MNDHCLENQFTKLQSKSKWRQGSIAPALITAQFLMGDRLRTSSVLINGSILCIKNFKCDQEKGENAQNVNL